MPLIAWFLVAFTSPSTLASDFGRDIARLNARVVVDPDEAPPPAVRRHALTVLRYVARTIAAREGPVRLDDVDADAWTRALELIAPLLIGGRSLPLDRVPLFEDREALTRAAWGYLSDGLDDADRARLVRAYPALVRAVVARHPRVADWMRSSHEALRKYGVDAGRAERGARPSNLAQHVRQRIINVIHVKERAAADARLAQALAAIARFLKVPELSGVCHGLDDAPAE